MSVLETAVVARKEEKTAVVRRLLEAGANPNLRFPSTGGFSNDDSALHHAAASENFTDLEIARLLLDHDALPNARDDEGNTPLHNLFDCLGKINYPMVELLLNRGADPNAANNEGETPLFHGDVFDEFEHWPEVLQLLSRHKANFNHVSKDGDTPLHHVVRLWA
ncbi:MAG: ankyrin repeat domain-containing protein, partial [Verrucomicrobiia bacterium]